MNKRKEETYLELNGYISIVKKVGGKIVGRDKIDGRLVLEHLLNIIKQEVELERMSHESKRKA